MKIDDLQKLSENRTAGKINWLEDEDNLAFVKAANDHFEALLEIAHLVDVYRHYYMSDNDIGKDSAIIHAMDAIEKLESIE